MDLVSAAIWVGVCVCCAFVGVIGGALAVGIAAGATRHRLIGERDEARRALKSYEDGASAAYRDGAE